MPPEPPPHSTRGLLEGIADTALDDDYYEVRAPEKSSRTNATLITAVGVALFALLMTIALVQNRSDRPAAQVERNTLLSNIDSLKASLDKGEKQAAKLRKEVTSLQALSNNVNPEYELLRMSTAARAARGQGIEVTVNNSRNGSAAGRITDIDLQILVNGLWYAGAEAISINGNRLGSLSSIRRAGQAITVNFKSIVAPYRITVIGNNESLGDRLSENPGGQYWAARMRKAGLRFSVQSKQELTVPAAPAKRLAILNADIIEGES